jgi:hypothetical protein
MHRVIRGAILTVAALIGLEFALRAASIVRLESGCFVADERIGYRLRPGSSCGGEAANALGFPDIDHAVLKRQGTVRVGIIGDSFVVGSVDRSARMSARLAAAAGPSFEIINLGLPFAGPRNYAGVLSSLASSLQLDLVVVVVFVGDDVLQSHPDFEARLAWRSPKEMLRAPYLLGQSKDYSYVFRAARSAWRARADPQSRFLSIERQRLEIFARRPSPFVITAYRGAVSALQQISDEARAASVRLIVALAPDEMQVDPAVAASVLSHYKLNAADFDFDLPSRRLTESLGTRRDEVIDLTPALREAARSAPVYLEMNTHWNERGNDAAAAYLSTRVASR